MAQRTVYDCDRCGEETVTERIGVSTRRYCDAAGSMDTEVEYVDLCLKCSARELRMFTDDLTYEDGKNWVRRVKK